MEPGPLARRLVDKIFSEERTVAGLMSGTSADGVDVVAVRLKGHGKEVRHRVLHKDTVPYPGELRKYILDSVEKGSVHDACLLNYLVAEAFSNALKDSIECSSIRLSEIDLIGSHGQTVHHFPEYVSLGGFSSRCSLQLGSVQVIAERTGVTTVGNFRVRDIAAGGQGAPIIAYVDYSLLSDPRKGRLVQNIGGIANVTVLPADSGVGNVYAFDTGPGNSLIDFAVAMLYPGLTYDPEGEIASKGSCDEEVLKELMAHEYVAKPPPKTTGREVFSSSLAKRIVEKGLGKGLSKEDVVATLTMFTVKSIVKNYDLFILPRVRVEEVIVGGGGARNRTLMKYLEEELEERGLRLLRHEDVGIDSKIKEALGMAVLAHATLSGVPNNIPGATGAGRSVVMGEIAL
ncbi:MAG: anhydro-N-acetylmuramic acid kinase [Thaumarchaeota archaeon]|jgi:anhydro-N-acetylmuramic acid kinase|nr:anhydro-N-acetylmuramic acid kinase [Nitrososphaerota archaeon]